MELVIFVPNTGVGELAAVVLLREGDKAVLLCQQRIVVAAIDGTTV